MGLFDQNYSGQPFRGVKIALRYNKKDIITPSVLAAYRIQGVKIASLLHSFTSPEYFHTGLFCHEYVVPLLLSPLTGSE